MSLNTFDPAGQEKVPPDLLHTPLGRLAARISEVSSLPDVAMRVIRLVDDPNSGAEVLSAAVRSDPALAMRVMRTVNSSFYALDEKVTDLKQAVAILGFREVRNLALTAHVAALFRSGEGHGRYTRRGLWNHLVATGMCARLVARAGGRVPPHEAYLAGLFHDMGMILLDQYAHSAFCRILDDLDGTRPAYEVEREVLGFDHAALGQLVAAQWNLPAHLAAAVGFHHDPLEAPEEHRALVCAVAVANSLCHRQDVTPLGVAGLPMPAPAVFAQVGVGRNELAQIAETLEEVLRSADVMAMVQVR